MRPRSLDEVVGQEQVLGPGRALRRAVEAGRLRSLLLWGPPGCGKTSIARLLAGERPYVALSAVLSGTKDLREALEKSEPGTVLFVDEIHRWNKAQQDALLPHVEDGSVILVGATTENPAFEVRRTLLSRMELVVLRPLGPPQIQELLRRAVADERGLGGRLAVSAEALEDLARIAGGDGRLALGMLDRCAEGLADGATLDRERVRERLARESVALSLDADEHYDLASALIKSMRASDPDAALYYLARMLESGEDLDFITRRLMIFASEDVGNAEPRAIQIAVSCAQGVERIGLPEGRILLGQAVSFLATCPKSNAAYKGINAALAEVRQSGRLPVPGHLRDASTGVAKDLGAGKGYLYPHDFPDAVVDQPCLPEAIQGRRFYDPRPWANEKTIRERMAWWEAKKKR